MRFLIAFFLFFYGVTSSPANEEAQQFKIYTGGGSHDVPTPFDAVNRRFELADGEYYLISGRVFMLPSLVEEGSALHPYLAVDFENYPWLANANRLKAGVYPLDGPVQEWQRLVRRHVKFVCRAHGKVVHGKHGPEYVISVDPVLYEIFLNR